MRLKLKSQSNFCLLVAESYEVSVATIEANFAGMTQEIVRVRTAYPWRRQECSRNRRAARSLVLHC